MAKQDKFDGGLSESYWLAIVWKSDPHSISIRLGNRLKHGKYIAIKSRTIALKVMQTSTFI